jgi:hypothetical protein
MPQCQCTVCVQNAECFINVKAGGASRDLCTSHANVLASERKCNNYRSTCCLECVTRFAHESSANFEIRRAFADYRFGRGQTKSSV